MFCLVRAELIVRVSPTLDLLAPPIEEETLLLVQLAGPHGPWSGLASRRWAQTF
jgi:hypothetical protein